MALYFNKTLQDGKKTGKGKLTRPDGTVQEGRWENGELVEGKEGG
jgi:hypothetical protein